MTDGIPPSSLRHLRVISGNRGDRGLTSTVAPAVALGVSMVDWDGTVVVTTARLVLRTYTRDDLPLYAALNADPEVVRYLGGEPLTREYSDDIAEWAQQCYAEEGLGLLAVARRDSGEFLGMCGLHHQETYPDEVEVGWRLARAHWGHGYATEAATGWLDHAFGPLDLPRVISITETSNVRSLAVMNRLGMLFDHEAKVVDDGVVHQGVIYSITAAAWRSRPRRESGGPQPNQR
jgi:RimJ/RimL family protein N-acetyltransferase